MSERFQNPGLDDALLLAQAEESVAGFVAPSAVKSKATVLPEQMEAAQGYSISVETGAAFHQQAMCSTDDAPADVIEEE